MHCKFMEVRFLVFISVLIENEDFLLVHFQLQANIQCSIYCYWFCGFDYLIFDCRTYKLIDLNCTLVCVADR